MSNNLANESSPYLLQHKDNPVNWYSWNDESLEKAKTENKPIFLSIGYSSCHWCHVMAHESFENDEVAKNKFMNFSLEQLIRLQELIEKKDYGNEKKAKKSKRNLLKQINVEIYKRDDSAIWK